jgi:hypothetical protein
MQQASMHKLLAVVIPIRLRAHPMYRTPLSSSSAAALLPASPPRLAVGDFAAALLPLSTLRLSADFRAFLFIGLPTDMREVPGVSSGIPVPNEVGKFWGNAQLRPALTVDMRS